MRSSSFLRVLPAASALTVLALVGCSKTDTPATSTTTTISSSGSGASGDATTTTAAAGGGDSSSASSGATVADGKADAAHTVTITKSGSTVTFTPSTLTIKAGEKVTFVGDGPGTFSVIVPGLSGMTVSGGLYESFTFPNTGTFTISEEISEATMTITVT